MAGTLISNNTTIKFSGTGVAASGALPSGNLYTVPAGKTFVGSYCIDNASGSTTVQVDGTIVGDCQSNGIAFSGPLYVNAGGVISYTVSAIGRVSIVGVLMENTP